MTLEFSNTSNAAGTPEADELAAILAVLESMSDAAPEPTKATPSRWRLAARSFEREAL